MNKQDILNLPIEVSETTPGATRSLTTYERDGYEVMGKLVTLCQIASEINNMELSFEINTKSKDSNNRVRCVNRKANFGKVAVACMTVTKQARETGRRLHFGVNARRQVITLEIGA